MSTLTTYAELEQGSDEWLQARRGLLTASTIGKLITPTLKVADNETSRGLTTTLAAERITGHVDYVHPSFDMQRGTDDEPYARAAYAENHAPVTEVGFMVRQFDTGALGYSPDGLVGEDGLIEIKSRKTREQFRAILTGQIPGENMAQLQAGMVVAGREWVDYVSYSEGLPLWTKRIYLNTAWESTIHAALETFETNVAEIITNYATAVEGLPVMERRPEFEEIRLQL